VTELALGLAESVGLACTVKHSGAAADGREVYRPPGVASYEAL
jgi:hypothetical protein